MPQPPNVEGLPPWLQITATLLFGIVTLIIGIKGYLKADPLKPLDNAQIIGAQIADMGAIRRLSDVCSELGYQVKSLEDAIREQTHYDRERSELMRELCQRLRELRERLDRSSGM